MKILNKTLLSILCSIAFINVNAQKYYLFVGSYTTPKGEGKGIEVYTFNATLNNIEHTSSIATENPSYLAIGKKGNFLYSVNQQDKKGDSSRVSAFSFNQSTGQLNFINRQNVNAVGPCYITVDSKNKWLFTANYFSGSISALPIYNDGSIAPLQQLIQHTGSSIVKSRQSEAHAHTAVLSHNEKYLFTTDLGIDQIHQYIFKSKAKQPLSIGEDSVTNFTPGSGPRHMAFHPNNKFLYVINELNGRVNVFEYNNGKLLPIQDISTDTTNNLDKGSGDIHVSPDGNFLYTTDRGKYNNISTFSINQQTSKLALIDVQSTKGKAPRNFIIEPTGKYVLVANQGSNNIVVFNRDIATGLLTYSGKEVQTGTPVCLKLLAIE